MPDMMNFQSLPRDDRPAPAVHSTPTSASPLRPLPTRHEAIGSVFEVSGGGARIQISGPRLRELAADADPSVAMSGQVGSQEKLESGGRWLLATVRHLLIIVSAGDLLSAEVDFLVVGAEEDTTGKPANFN